MAKSSASEPVTVRIGGEDHTIRANVKPEYTRRCAKMVDDRISEIRSQLGLIESHKAAILAALSITDELLQARSAVEDLRGSANAWAEGLAGRLEEALAGHEDPPPPAQEALPDSGPAQLTFDQPVVEASGKDRTATGGDEVDPA